MHWWQTGESSGGAGAAMSASPARLDVKRDRRGTAAESCWVEGAVVRGSGRRVARLERRVVVWMTASASHWARDMQAVGGLAMATRGHCVAQVGRSSVSVRRDRLDCLTRSWRGREGMSLPSLTVMTDTGAKVSRR
jgi:hypothetical protein